MPKKKGKKRRAVGVYLEEDEYAWLAAIAANEERTMSSVVRYMVRAYIDVFRREHKNITPSDR